MTMVTERAVIVPVLFNRITSSLYQGLLALIAGVMVTPPVPPPPLTVREIVVVRVNPPPVAVMATFVEPNVAALEAVKVTVELVPVVEGGLKVAVTPLGNPLALKATLPANPPARVTVSVLAALAP